MDGLGIQYLETQNCVTILNSNYLPDVHWVLGVFFFVLTFYNIELENICYKSFYVISLSALDIFQCLCFIFNILP